MGLSASECRLLCLTSKLSDLEYQAQVIDNAKISLDNQSSAASTVYENALNQEKLTVYNSDTKAYVDASAYNLTNYDAVSSTDKQRIITDSAGRVVVSTTLADAYTKANSVSTYLQNYDLVNNLAASDSKASSDTNKNGNISLTEFLAEEGVTTTSTGSYTWTDDAKKTGGKETTYPSGCTTDEEQQSFMSSLVSYYTNVYNGKESFMETQGYTSATSTVQSYLTTLDPNMKSTFKSCDKGYDSVATSYYSNVYDQINENGYNAVSSTNYQSSEWLYQQIETGNLNLEEYSSKGGSNGTGAWENVAWDTGDSTLKTTSDDTAVSKAEAEYNLTTTEIQSEDKKYDLELDKIDTEHSAVQTEIDSVKSVIGKNIERSYKTFSA